MMPMPDSPRQTSLIPEPAPKALRRKDKKAPDAVLDFVEVAVDVPLYKSFTYRVPEALAPVIAPGVRVLVPFRGRSTVAVALGRVGPPERQAVLDKVVEIGDVLDVEPVIDADMVKMLRWMASYYHAPIGEVLKLALPAALRVDSSRELEITPVGRKAVTAGVVTDPKHRALLSKLVVSNGPIDAQVLRERIKGLTYITIAHCEKAGWLESHYVAGPGGASIKYEKLIRLRRDPYVDERIGRKQAEILLRLQELNPGEAIRMGDLRQDVSSPGPSLRILEQKGIVSIDEQEVYRDPFAEAQAIEVEDREPTPDQAQVIGALRAQLSEGAFKTFLLHGVTGSGKTEVYVRVIKDALERGRGAIILLPEISLTPQFVAVFRGHFGDQIAVLHSGLTPGQRFDAWRRIARGEVRIAIGARSAIFAPMSDLGVIIVDEEHDTSFKQETGCRYNARDVAQFRGRLSDAVVILGSATPSVESYFNARQNKIGYLPMDSRVNDRGLPGVEIVDMRREPGVRSKDPEQEVQESLSPELTSAIHQTLAARQQVILFLNRRGYSPFVVCRDCGLPWRCPNCSVSLTLHKNDRRLRCHYCDYSVPEPKKCPKCASDSIGHMGVGTERLEAALKETFPGSRVARLDRDTGHGGRLIDLIARFRDHEIDILLGTQMVTKGHDFHNVTLVGVIMADQGLNFPDFRSGERTFQLLTQVAGRAGRGDKTGRVIIQTYTPWHYALEAAREHSFSEFVSHEIQARADLAYPPFTHLAAVLFEGRDERAVITAAREYTFSAKRLVADSEPWREAITVLGPAQAPLARLRGKTRWQMLLKGQDRPALRAMLGALLEAMGYFTTRSTFPGVSVQADVDPQNML